MRQLRSRLATRVAVAASALALFFILVMGVGGWLVTAGMLRDHVRILLQTETALRGEKIADLLDGLVSGYRTLAANSAAAVMVAPNEFTRPLMADMAELNGLSTRVRIFDKTGRFLPRSEGESDRPVDPWVSAVLESGRSRVQVQDGGSLGPLLSFAEPIRSTAGGNVVGILVWQVTLADLARRAASPTGAGIGSLELVDATTEQHYTVPVGDGVFVPDTSLRVDVPVRLPVVMDSFRLSMLSTARDEVLSVPLARFTTFFVAIGLSTILLVVAMSALMGQRLTRALSTLSDAATSFAFGHGDRSAFAIGGNDEISRLGYAFSGMVERLDQAYRDLERRSLTLLSNAERVAKVGSASYDPATGQEVWSDQFCVILGMAPGSARPSRQVFNERIHPDDRIGLHDLMQEVAVQGGDSLAHDFRVVWPDGTIRVVQFLAAYLWCEGTLLRMDFTLQDITERKAMEARLDGVVEELRRSNAELEQFAYVASHDLRQPLRTVGSYVTLIEESLHDRLDDETREFMDFIRDGVRRMDTLITDLLAYSRVGRRDKDGAVEVWRAVELALIDLQVEIEQAQADVQVTQDLPVVDGEMGEITRLFQNLIGNAVKYRDPSRRPCVQVSCFDRHAFWEFQVSDNGIGIPAVHAERVFGIFQRLHSRDQYEGTGIGLAICRKIVEHRGGRIWCDPNVREGTSLRFTWPKLRYGPAPETMEPRVERSSFLLRSAD